MSRVAVNLAGVERQGLARGEVLGHVGTRRATATFDAVIRPVRGLAHAVTTKGAFAVYAGAAEAGATLRFLGPSQLDPGGEAFVRVRLSHPMVLDPFDRFVLRDAGRQETVGGGTVLDPFPPLRPGADAHLRLSARASASLDDLPRLLTTERGAVRVTEALRLTGSAAPAPVRIGGWFVRDDLGGAVERSLAGHLEAFHAAHPLEEGLPTAGARDAVADALKVAGAPRDPGLIDALLDDLAERGDIARSAATVRLPGHRVALDERSEDVDRLLAAVGGDREATPPTVRELQADGLGRDVIEAAARAGVIVRVSPELVFTPGFVAKAESIVREAGLVRDHGERVPRGARHEPEVRPAPAGVVRPSRDHPARRRPAVPARRGRLTPGARLARDVPGGYPVSCAVTCTSTHAPSGRDAIPIAARACFPGSPRTSTSSSLAPFATVGWSTNSGVEAT